MKRSLKTSNEDEVLARGYADCSELVIDFNYSYRIIRCAVGTPRVYLKCLTAKGGEGGRRRAAAVEEAWVFSKAASLGSAEAMCERDARYRLALIIPP